MRYRRRQSAFGFAALLIVVSVAWPADAGFQLITNGDFENGLTGWTTAVQAGSDGGWFSQTGTLSPLTSFAVQAPPGPTHAAMSDGFSGSSVLYQDFLVPQGGIAAGLAATLSFDLSIANQGRGFTAPFNPLSTLDYTVDGNRQARVDILAAGSDPFSIVPGQVLLNLYTTAAGDPNFSGYSVHTADVTALLNAHPGQILRLRYSEVNNLSFFRNGPLNFGVDRVSLDVSSPEPTSLVLLTFGLLGLASYAWRRSDRSPLPAPVDPDGPAAPTGDDPRTR